MAARAPARPSWLSIYRNRLNLHILPTRSPIALRFVGQQMNLQLRQAGITTLQHLLNHLFQRGATVAANRVWLQTTLANPRALQCVGKANRAVRNNRYSVLDFNLFAFNSLVTYARRHANTRVRKRKVPACAPFRNPVDAFPDRCRRR